MAQPRSNGESNLAYLYTAAPLEKLRYFGHWPNTPKFKAGMRPDIRQLEEISLGIGRWLHPKIEDRRHAHIYEISTIHFR